MSTSSSFSVLLPHLELHLLSLNVDGLHVGVDAYREEEDGSNRGREPLDTDT